MMLLFFTMLSVYIIGIAIMFFIPESWMPKGKTPDKIVVEKEFYRKVFIIGGAVILAITILINCIAT